MSIKNKPIRFLFKIVRAIWRFPWIRVSLTVCLISVVCAVVLQKAGVENLASSIGGATGHAIERMEDSVIGKTLAQEETQNPATPADPSSKINRGQGKRIPQEVRRMP